MVDQFFLVFISVAAKDKQNKANEQQRKMEPKQASDTNIDAMAVQFN